MINPRPHLHPGVDSDQVLTVAVDEVSEWASHLGVDGQEDGDLHEGDQVQGASLVAEEELLVAEHLGQNLEDEHSRLFSFLNAIFRLVGVSLHLSLCLPNGAARIIRHNF